MSVPGVSVITATTFTSAIADIHRFGSPGRLVGYLGLDSTARQSANELGAPRPDQQDRP